MILVFVFFYVMAPPFRQVAAFTTVLYQSSTLGIPAVAVALLMIGGEFDLSAGVAVTTSSLAASMFATEVAGNLWVGMIFALLLLARARRAERLPAGEDQAAQLPGDAVDLPDAARAEHRDHQAGDRQRRDRGHQRHARLQLAHAALRLQHHHRQRQRQHRDRLLDHLRAHSRTWVLLRTRIGNWIFAVGGAAATVRAPSAFRCARSRSACSCWSASPCWFTGMHMLFAYDTVQSGAGIGNELLYIASAVVGGCLLTGGYGSAIGSALGAFIFGMTTEGVIYADWDPDWFMFFVGAMLLLATVFNGWLRVRAISRGK